jgi:CDP-paratose 2-epimerase
MRVLVTGICGFVGRHVATDLKQSFAGVEVVGLDNLIRRGSEINVAPLKALGCTVVHGDVRAAEDIAELPRCDWVIDCAANPSVLAGVSGGTSQLVSHNLVGTLNLLEKCRRDSAGFFILSTSRVYSIDAVNEIPLVERGSRFVVDETRAAPAGSSEHGISETFSTDAPVSLYGGTKLASEIMALEYAAAFGFPVWINRCGVIAGPGQFGRIDQGIFSYWIYQWILGRPLNYIGYGGKGLQVRDFVSPRDLTRLIDKQLRNPTRNVPRIVNVGGGADHSSSLLELSEFCQRALGAGPSVQSVAETRRYDLPYFVTDARLADQLWGWRPEESAEETLESIARWAQDHRAVVEGLAAS